MHSFFCRQFVFATLLIRELLHHAQRFSADMMFNALRIDCDREFWQKKCWQKEEEAEMHSFFAVNFFCHSLDPRTSPSCATFQR